MGILLTCARNVLYSLLMNNKEQFNSQKLNPSGGPVNWSIAPNPIAMMAELLCFSGRVYAIEILQLGRVVDRFFALGRKEPGSFARYHMGHDPVHFVPCKESELNARLERGVIRFSRVH